MKTVKIIALAALFMLPSISTFAQKWGETPEDSLNCLTNTFLYREAYKNKQYETAYEPWVECLKTCPANNKNLYIRGVTILKYKFQNAKTDEERNATVEELMAMYDLRIKYFGEAAEVNARKAFDLEQLCPKTRLKDAYTFYAEAMRLGGDKIDAAYIERFFDLTIRYVSEGYADTSLIIDNYDIASDALDAQIAQQQDSAKKADIYKVVGNIEARFSPFASCDELVAIYTKKFNADSENIDLLKKITTMLRKKKCTNTDLFFATTEKLYSLEPTPSTAFLMGQMCYNKDKYSDAARYVNEALKEAEDGDKYNLYILLGLCYSKTNSYSAARSAYMKAAEADGSKGEPYRLIAMLYASSARSIDDGLGGRTAYWAAVDLARRAISVDSSPENVEAAQALINSYSGHFPTQSNAFMLDLIDGSSYTVPGWIGVSTIVRTRK